MDVRTSGVGMKISWRPTVNQIFIDIRDTIGEVYIVTVYTKVAAKASIKICEKIHDGWDCAKLVKVSLEEDGFIHGNF